VIFGLRGAEGIAKETAKATGIKFGEIEQKLFADGEMYINSLTSVRNKKVYIIQSTSNPASDRLIELFLLLDALKRSSATELIVVFPYYGYARQDRKGRKRETIAAKLMANLVTTAGATKAILIDIHSEQTQAFFECPVDSISMMKRLAKHVLSMKIDNPVIVSPDHGGLSRAREFALNINAEVAVIDKRRPNHNEVSVQHILGDVKGKNCIIVDDMIDTGGTIVAATAKLKEEGAKDVFIVATHSILSNGAEKKLKDAGISKIITTDSIDSTKASDFVTIIPIAPLVSRFIELNNKNESILDDDSENETSFIKKIVKK